MIPVYLVITERNQTELHRQFGIYTILDCVAINISNQEQINRLYSDLDEMYRGISIQTFLVNREPDNPFREWKQSKEEAAKEADYNIREAWE